MRNSALVVALIVLAAPAVAHAQAKDACITAYEQTQTLRNDGRFVSARAKALVCAKASCPPLLAKDCTRWASELAASTPSVILEAQTTDGDPLHEVRVTVDGAPFANRLDGSVAPIDPGKHVFHFESRGATYDETALLREGEKNRHIQATLAVSKERAHGGSEHALPAGFWIFGGITVVSAGVATTFAADRDLDVKSGPFTVAGVALGASVVAALATVYLLVARP